MFADALATALMVLGPGPALGLAESDGIAARLVVREGWIQNFHEYGDVRNACLAVCRNGPLDHDG